MKLLSVVLLASVLLGTALALKGIKMPSIDSPLSLQQKDLDDALKARFKALRRDDEDKLGPAINWTWNSWSDGPACNDLRKLSLVDLSDDSVAKINDDLSFALSQSIDFLIAHHINCSLGLGVTYNGKMIFLGTKGFANYTSGEEATPDSVISIGSISKIFTSMMMNILAEKGALDASDPVTKFFNKESPPEFNPPNPYDANIGASAVTLESLSSQSSGLPREAQCATLENCTEELALTWGNKYPLLHPPLTRPHYSNYGFSLLGHCCERAARKQSGSSDLKYEDWVKDNILTPFNMTLSAFDFPPEIKSHMAVGYGFNDSDGSQIVEPEYALSLGWSNPAGGMCSSLNDMMKFISHLLDMDGVLSPNGYEEYFLAGPPLPDGVSSYGKSGWEVAYANGYRTLTKGGLYGGFATTIAFIPQIKLGVFFLD